MDEDMAKVKVTREITVVPNQTSTVLYKAGWEGTAPRAHIEQIVAADAGEAVVTDAPKQEPKQAPVSLSGQASGQNLS